MPEALLNLNDHLAMKNDSDDGSSAETAPSFDSSDPTDPLGKVAGWRRDNPSGWIARHHELVAAVREASPRVVFIGDSITQGWAEAGLLEWTTRFQPLNAVNLGIGGDQTQQILWRLASGVLDQANPELVVLMIGVNNLWEDVFKVGVARVAQGIHRVSTDICERCPAAKLLLLAILPTQENADHPLRSIVREVNAASRALHSDNERVTFVDFETLFLEPDDTILASVMPDYCHLSEEGYFRLAQALEPLVLEILGSRAAQ
jgi:beta-glucosidase